MAAYALPCLCSKKGRPGKPTTADVVSMGDAWLERVVREGIVQPIPNARQCRWWVSSQAIIREYLNRM